MSSLASPSRLALAALLLTACGFGLGVGDRPRQRQCEALVVRVAATSLPAAPDGLDLRLRAEQLQISKWHPHSGSVCFYAGLVPEGWTPITPSPEAQTRPDVLAWAAPDGGAELRYTLTGPESAGYSRAAWIEGRELAPARARATIVRETAGLTADGRERRRLLVTREGDVVQLRVLRQTTVPDADDAYYFRCEATLRGPWTAALPRLEAACDAVRVRHWEHPPW